MKTIVFTLLVISLLVIPMVSAKEIPNGIMNKFENFKDCFLGTEKKCHQFNYDKNDVVGFTDFGVFLGKYSKMIK